MKKFRDNYSSPSAFHKWLHQGRHYSRTYLEDVANNSLYKAGYRAVNLFWLVKHKYWTKDELRVWLVKQRLGIEVANDADE